MSFSPEEIEQELKRRGAIPANNFSRQQVRDELVRRGVLKSPTDSFGEEVASAASRGGRDLLAGMAQLGHTALNAPHNLAAAILGQKLASHIPTQQEYDYSAALGIPEEQKNIADRLIQFAPEALTAFTVPEAELGVAGRAIESIPKVGKYLKTAAGNALSQGTLAAAQAPQNQGKAALTASAIAAPFGVLGKGAMEADPIVRNISKVLLGSGAATLGYEGAKAAGGSDKVNDIAGALMGVLGYKGGAAQTRAARNVLEGVNGSNYQDVLEAAKRLKLGYVTPAEASDNPFVAATQGDIGRTKGGAQLLYNKGMERLKTEKNAIGNLYDTITKSPVIASGAIRDAVQKEFTNMNEARLNASEPYYQAAHAKRVAPSWVTNLENSDPTIKNAIASAMSDPKYQVEGELLNEPKNSIKVLDYAKRRIDAQIEQAKNFGDNDAVRVLTNSKNKLLNKISKVDQDYAAARRTYEQYSKPIEKLEKGQLGRIANTKDTQLKNLSSSIFDPNQTDPSVLRQIRDTVQKHDPAAWNSIVKNEMQRLMSKSKYGGGTAFYNEVLANDNRFNQFKAALENNNKASEQLDDMRLVFKNLINVSDKKAAHALSKTSMSKEREETQTYGKWLKQILTGGKYDKAAVEIATNPDWADELHKLNMPSNRDILVGKTYKLFGNALAQGVA